MTIAPLNVVLSAAAPVFIEAVTAALAAPTADGTLVPVGVLAIVPDFAEVDVVLAADEVVVLELVLLILLLFVILVLPFSHCAKVGKV